MVEIVQKNSFPILEIVTLMLDTVELAPPIVSLNTIIEPTPQMVSLPWIRAGWIARVQLLPAGSRRLVIAEGALPHRKFPLTSPSERPHRMFPWYPI
jgi:hypothetical protein